MSAIANEWFISIVSGIITAALLLALTTVMVPGFRKLFMRRSMDLAGVWDVFDASSAVGDPAATWTVNQWGHRVWGRVVRYKNRRGDDMRREFMFRGTVHADQICCVFQDRSGRHRTGAIVLRWMGSDNGSSTLSGMTVYWDRTPHAGEPDAQDASGVVALPYTIRKRFSG